MSYKIVQHCFGKPSSGGPIVAMGRFLERSKEDYKTIIQDEPAGGVSLKLIYRFYSELRSLKPNLVHIRGLGNEGFHAVIAARMACVPCILVSIHGTQRDLLYPKNKYRHWIVKSILEPITLALATNIATVCEYTAKRDFLKFFSGKISGVVPNGVDIPDIMHLKNKNIRKLYGIEDNKLVGVCVSRITVEKGYLVLAESLKKIDEVGVELAILVVGGGDQDEIIRKKFLDLKYIKVYFVGHKKNVGEYLSASDFFIFPSLHENMSNALLEAMSYGLPVVATAVGGNVEVLKRGGGILVEAGNSEEMADAILNITSDIACINDLGVAARNNICINYSVDVMVDNWQNMYKKILEKKYAKF